jgi:hypothetical protein
MTAFDVLTLAGGLVLVALIVKGFWPQTKIPPKSGPPDQTGGWMPPHNTPDGGP